MYGGLVQLENTFTTVVLVTSVSTGAPNDADALPTFRIYGDEGTVASGTCSLLDSGTVVTASNATPIVVTTSAPHGLNTGARVNISGVTGNSGANGSFTITKTGSTTFTLNNSTGAGAGTGGSYHVVGAYALTVNVLGASGFEAGGNYTAVIDYALSTVAQCQIVTFTVV
jgi:hypothetical protein